VYFEPTKDDQMLRSFLFCPATSERKMVKAFESLADAVVIDLEDAVAINEKVSARLALPQILAQPRSKPAYVRVNALTTRFCFDDLKQVAIAAPEGIIFPKAESASDLKTVDWVLAQLEAENGRRPGSIELIPIIETAAGIAAVDQIAKAVSRVRRLAFGAVDFALDMNLELDQETGALSHARFAIALASRVAGLDGPVDTAFPDIQALDRLRDSALNARRMGYRGKYCIHPKQIEVVNAVFTPSPEEIEQARRVVAAFEAAERSGAGAVSLDGLMIDYPVADKARRLLQTHSIG
jgi:citrate lyase subunit beta/citryl-CoA lyase